jgi:D-threo-aldose 1-dehydrogenase
MPDTALPQIALAKTGRITTRLGFGCSGLMGGLSERESLRLLDAAFDAGIRHFDVAPSYGYGMAEACVGKFLRGKREQVTVTTKYGILAPRHAAALDWVRRGVQPVVHLAARSLPSLRQRAASAAASLKASAKFSADEASAALLQSLRALGTDHVDVLLLHEATADDLADPALLDFLQEQVRLERIGSFGVGSDAAKIPALWRERRLYCRVLQFDWPGFGPSALAQGPDGAEAFRIHHRVWNVHGVRIAEQLERNSEMCRQWSAELDLDLRNRENLATLLLIAAQVAHPGGIVLFSSRTPAHILANARSAGDPGWSLRAECFHRLFGAR